MIIGLLSVGTIGRFSEPFVSNLKKAYEMCIPKNHPCQARLTIVNINSDEILFYPFTFIYFYS